MQKLKMFVLTVAVFPPAFVFAQDQSFNADSAYAYIEHLTVAIGPRPMGSANERVALQWAADKFRSFGADTAYVMPVPEAKMSDGAINTNSGVAVGIFSGKTDSTIVIGGHIDAAGREIPGANDDASGTACMIELARVWSQRPRHYTLLFAAFGGEESGLIGSEYFVAHYPEISRVALMLQIDMAGIEEFLVPFIDVKTHQAPQWLVEDAYAIDRTLGYNSLDYPTHFFSINNAFGGAGSDHQPFLEKNIPAIDFTTGLNTSPIHAPGDKIDFIKKPMLARSGRLVDGLLTKYDEQRIPAARKGNYMLWELFGGRLFIPTWMITGTVALALLLGVLAFIRSRKQRMLIEKSERVKFSGTKLFSMMIVIAIFTQLGEALMQLIRGLRFPWMVAFEEYMWFAAIWTLAGVWVVSQVTRKWRFSPDPYVYAKRALIFLFIIAALLSLSNFRLALYPALTLIALSLAIFIPSPILKILTMLLAPISMFNLIFMEVLPFGARSLASGLQGVDSFVEAFFYSAFLTALLVLWFLPSLYIFAYTWASTQPLFNFMKYFRHPIAGLVILLAIFGYGGYLFSFPAYNEKWRAELNVNADYDLRSDENTLRLVGNEYFRKVKVTADTLHREYDGRIHHDSLSVPFKADWATLSGTESILSGKRDTVVVNWQLASARPWYRVSLNLRADTLNISDVTANVRYRLHDERGLTFAWYYEPPDTLNISARFTTHAGANLIREMIAIYPDMPVPVNVTAELADVMYRTTVTWRDTLALPRVTTNVVAEK